MQCSCVFSLLWNKVINNETGFRWSRHVWRQTTEQIRTLSYSTSFATVHPHQMIMAKMKGRRQRWRSSWVPTAPMGQLESWVQQFLASDPGIYRQAAGLSSLTFTQELEFLCPCHLGGSTVTNNTISGSSFANTELAGPTPLQWTSH